MKICPRCNTKYEDKANVCNHDGVRLEPLMEETQTQQFDEMVGQVLAGRFKIISKLGQGGMGAVYKAEQMRVNRMCAIKVIPEEMAKNGDAIERFDREAKMSALINDPHAVTVYDFGEAEGGTYFLAMEFVEGETLSSLLRREGVLSLDRTLTIARQGAEALAAAHKHNVVHRDLKPDNIMIAKKDGKDWVKVLDFGIAKFSADDRRNDLTRQGLVIGTPLYMSPEQLAGEKIDPRSDIYSFALIIFQMLSGGLPFDGDNAQALMVKRLTDNPLPIRTINPNVHVPPGVENALLAALARDRNMRTATIQQFIAEMEQGARESVLNTSPTVVNSTARQLPNTPSTNPNPYYSQPNSGQQPGWQQPPQQGMPNYTPSGPQPTPYPPQGQNPPTPAQPFQPAPYNYGGQPQPYAQPMPGPSGPYQPQMPQTVPAPYPLPVKKSRKGLWIVGSIIGVFTIIFGGLVLVGLLGALAEDPQPQPNNTENTQPADNSGKSNNSGSNSSATTTSSSASELNSEGLHLLEQRNYQAAADKFRAAAKLQPNVETYENLAIALYMARNFNEAVDAAQQAVDSSSEKRAKSFNILGRALYDSKRYLEASAALSQSFLLDQSEPEVAVLAAFALQLSGNKEKADEFYDSYLALYPNSQYSNYVRQVRAGEALPPSQLPQDEPSGATN